MRRLGPSSTHHHPTMLQVVLTFLFALVPTCFSAELTDAELSTSAQEVLAHAGFLYKLPFADRKQFIEYARSHGIDSAALTTEKRKEKIKVFFKTNRLRYSALPRVFYLPEVMYKKTIPVYGWAVPLSKLFKSLPGKHYQMAEFINAITQAVVSNYRVIDEYILDEHSVSKLKSLNKLFQEKCSNLTEDEKFKRDIENLHKQAAKVLKRRPNAKKIILEAVALAVFEVLRVTPCVLDSTDDPKTAVEKARRAFGLPTAQTIFDPLPKIFSEIENDAGFLDAFRSAAPGLPSLGGDLMNAQIRLGRFWEDNKEGFDADVVTKFVEEGDFAEGSSLAELSQIFRLDRAMSAKIGLTK